MGRKRKYASEDEDDGDDFIAHSDEEEEEAAVSSEEEAVASESEEESYKPRAKRARNTKVKFAATVPAFDNIAPVQDFSFNPMATAPIVQPALLLPDPIANMDNNEQEEDTPYCDCGEPTLRKTIEKKGRNQGKQFYGCRNYPDGCKFFRFAPSNITYKKKQQTTADVPAAAFNFGAPTMTTAPVQSLNLTPIVTAPIIQPPMTIVQPPVMTPIIPPLMQPAPLLPDAVPNNYNDDDDDDDDGEEEEDTPYCDCDEPTVRKTIEKKGRNQGKEFYGCRNWPDGCKFFRFAPSNITYKKKQRKTAAAFNPSAPTNPALSLLTDTSAPQYNFQASTAPTMATVQPQVEQRSTFTRIDDSIHVSSSDTYVPPRLDAQPPRVMPMRKQTVAEAMGIVPTTEFLIQLHLLDMSENELRLLVTRLVNKAKPEKLQEMKKEMADTISQRKQVKAK